MSQTMTDMDCGRVLAQLDLYLDRELAVDERAALERHLESCADCARVAAQRSALRHRMRQAIETIAVPEGLRGRVTASLGGPGQRTNLQRWSMGIAAAVMMTAGLGVVYQLGHLRFTVASQESYIGAISRQVPPLMRVGLGDHVHCAVYRKFAKDGPPPEKIADDMGPRFLPLVQIVREHVPANQKVVKAHRCTYHGRKFVHIAMVDGSHMTSLVIAERQPGESFQVSGLLPALSDTGLPVYHANVQRFQIDGFQTDAHLVYVISDFSREDNSRMVARLAPPVREFLRQLEL